MFESPRNLNTPQQRLERSQMLAQIRASERSLITFVSRMAQNKKFQEERPNLHKFFASLHSFRAVRGTLTDKQKIALNREIDKYADYFMTLRVAKPAVENAQTASPVVNEDAPLDESDVQALDDEREGMMEA